ncbi:MAG TPA: 50S ribosomal protein L15 [Chloroflexota bacterium]|nr:50S ribosomal protein L15 [Chloroflexota bacterium]
MRLHELKPAAGSTKNRKRIGRGNASGQGTTAGKGTKGEKARSGGLKAGFRGMSSRNQRLAKRRGFNNRWKVSYRPVNLESLRDFKADNTVDLPALISRGLVGRSETHVKLLGDGELSVPLHVVGLAVSKSARQKIEAAGGSITTEIQPAVADSPAADEEESPLSAVAETPVAQLAIEEPLPEIVIAAPAEAPVAEATPAEAAAEESAAEEPEGEEVAE